MKRSQGARGGTANHRRRETNSAESFHEPLMLWHFYISRTCGRNSYILCVIFLFFFSYSRIYERHATDSCWQFSGSMFSEERCTTIHQTEAKEKLHPPKYSLTTTENVQITVLVNGGRCSSNKKKRKEVDEHPWGGFQNNFAVLCASLLRCSFATSLVFFPLRPRTQERAVQTFAGALAKPTKWIV